MKDLEKINVYIVGGGVSGMTAAHELCKKKLNGKPIFNITIFEKDAIYVGGKARSVEHKRNEFSETNTFNFLPAEHGFRFFPGFYCNLDQTLKEIPIENDNKKTVFQNLVQTSTYMFAFFKNKNRKPIELLNKTQQWDYIGSVVKMIRSVRDATLDINSKGKNNFAYALFKMITSSQLRKVEELERESWFDFINAQNKSYGTDYDNFFADGLTRSLAAAKSRKTSTRTGSLILPKMLFEVIAPGGAAGRVLNAPTNEAWLVPWKKHLEKAGVKFEMGAYCVDIECENVNKSALTDFARARALRQDEDDAYYIEHVLFKKGGQIQRIENPNKKSIFLFAIPVEKMAKLLTDSRDADLFRGDPSLRFVLHLKESVDWMCGIVFYFKKKVDITNGHINLMNSKWAITGIHQEQFWTNDYQPERFGDGKVKGILSLIMSNCDEDSDVCDKRSVFEMTRDDIIKEAWEQIKQSAFIKVKEGNTTGFRCPTDDDIYYEYTFLDDAISERRKAAVEEINDYLDLQDEDRFNDFEVAYRAYKRVRNEGTLNALNFHHGKAKKKVYVCDNDSKLLVNYVNMYCNRPSTYTRIPNMFLAGDYVRTDVDLATMEGACESGKRAANALIQMVKDSKLHNADGDYNKLRLSKIQKYQNPFYRFLTKPLFLVFALMVLVSGVGTFILLIDHSTKYNFSNHLPDIGLLKDIFSPETSLHVAICGTLHYFKLIPLILVIYVFVKHILTKPELKVLLLSTVLVLFSILCIWFLYPMFFILVIVILLSYFLGFLFFRYHVRKDERNYKEGMTWVPFSNGSLFKKLIFYLLRGSGKA